MRFVCRDAGARAGRHRRQLLRAWRRQHHVDPAGQPGPQGRADDHAARGVPASDGGDAGGGGGRPAGERRHPSRHRHRDAAGDADHVLAGGTRRADRPLQPGDARDGAGGAARGSSGWRAADAARSPRCAAAAARRCGRRDCGSTGQHSGARSGALPGTDEHRGAHRDTMAPGGGALGRGIGERLSAPGGYRRVSTMRPGAP